MTDPAVEAARKKRLDEILSTTYIGPALGNIAWMAGEIAALQAELEVARETLRDVWNVASPTRAGGHRSEPLCSGIREWPNALERRVKRLLAKPEPASEEGE